MYLVCVANRRQIGLWEKKLQLVKETRSTVGEVQDEIKMMKKEIHRMEVNTNDCTHDVVTSYFVQFFLFHFFTAT